MRSGSDTTIIFSLVTRFWLPLLLFACFTRTIPIVFVDVVDPVGVGFVTSLARREGAGGPQK
jgi:hypothetical protein